MPLRHESLVELAQGELRAHALLVIGAQLEDRRACRGSSRRRSGRRSPRSASRFAAGAATYASFSKQRCASASVHCLVCSLMPDSSRQMRVSASLTCARRSFGSPLPIPFVEHHLLGVMGPPVLPGRRLGKRVQPDPDAPHFAGRPAHVRRVQPVPGHRFVRRRVRERRVVVPLEPRLLLRRATGPGCASVM